MGVRVLPQDGSDGKFGLRAGSGSAVRSVRVHDHILNPSNMTICVQPVGAERAAISLPSVDCIALAVRASEPSPVTGAALAVIEGRAEHW
jgi:hypothetical protein